MRGEDPGGFRPQFRKWNSAHSMAREHRTVHGKQPPSLTRQTLGGWQVDVPGAYRTPTSAAHQHSHQGTFLTHL